MSTPPPHSQPDATDATEADDERLPSFSEQVADQLGGVRGMIESSIPVGLFVISFLLWSLRVALIISVTAAVGLACYRLYRKQSVRHALNGLVGIGVGAYFAWRTGNPKDFYLPGILLGMGYGVALLVSIVARRPLVGWIWSLVADGGSTRWRTNQGLLKIFGWLTALWASFYVAKVAIQVFIYFTGSLTDDQKATILGITRIALGYPPYALLLAVTVWAVRRNDRAEAALAGSAA